MKVEVNTSHEVQLLMLAGMGFLIYPEDWMFSGQEVVDRNRYLPDQSYPYDAGFLPCVDPILKLPCGRHSLALQLACSVEHAEQASGLQAERRYVHMNESRHPRLFSSPSTNGCHFYLARQTCSGIRLTNLDTTCVVLADEAVEAGKLERSQELERLVTMRTPLVLVAKGEIHPLSGVGGNGHEKSLFPARLPGPCGSQVDHVAMIDARRKANVWDHSLCIRFHEPAWRPLMASSHTRLRPRVVRAIRYMVDHLQDEITLEDLAKEACLSPCYFCRLFKLQVGMTCTKYLSKLRVQEAIRLLLDSDLSVTEICYRVGFNDLTHFERVFKSLTRATPSGYRRCSSESQDSPISG